MMPTTTSNGLATVIKIAVGKQYWVVAREKATQKAGAAGDMASARAYSEEWQPDVAGSEWWDHEGVILRAGDTL